MKFNFNFLLSNKIFNIFIGIFSFVFLGFVLLIFISNTNTGIDFLDKYSGKSKPLSNTSEPLNPVEDSPSPISKEEKNTEVSISFIGDMMFDRQIRRIAEETDYEHLFDFVSERFNEHDLVVGNLEGPISDHQTIYKEKLNLEQYTFTFDPKVTKKLYDANIRLVFLDNNHISNFGNSGIEQTLDNLIKNNISYFGNPYDRKILSYKIKDIKFSFMSYNQFIRPDANETIKNIKEAQNNSDYIVVYTHWGEEYFKKPNEQQINLAHSFVDAGADLVIGTHPHVIQSKEIYKDKYIYYSLGNFIFDQYFSEDVKCGAVANFIFDEKGSISVSEEFVELHIDDVVKFSDCLDLVPLDSF